MTPEIVEKAATDPDPVLENLQLTALAVSPIVNFALAVFMFVQMRYGDRRTRAYACFGLTLLMRAGLDVARMGMGKEVHVAYEGLRVIWVVATLAAGLCILSESWSRVVRLAAVPAVIGGLVWVVAPGFATTAAFPLAFIILAIGFSREYQRGGGFAPLVLSGQLLCLGLLCSAYFFIAQSSSFDLLLGYVHYGVLLTLSVLVGWTHLPRELRQRSPVSVGQREAYAYLGGLLISELAIILGLLWSPDRSTTIALWSVGNLAYFGVTLVLFFLHRHRLVIFTENVSQLLDERTADLRAAQVALASINENQQQRLDAQALELESRARELRQKAEVIDRQRRLELAAETAGQAAHDIRNLTHPITASAERLAARLSEADPPLPPELLALGRAELDRIRRQVALLLDLNEQFLSIARRGRVDLEPLPCAELLETIVEHFPDRPPRLILDQEPWIQGSWSQLSRALTNLVRNAYESDPEAPPNVTLRCSMETLTATTRCHLGFLSPGSYAVIEVEDDGPGIPEAIIDRIFDPFFSSKSTRGTSGSGLGLSIVRAVIEDHSGTLDLLTNAAGTNFLLYLPAIPEPGALVPAEDLRGYETILVIDDDSEVLASTSAVLEGAGYNVIQAASGRDALKRLQVEQIDLALLDLRMKDLSGEETFQHARHLRGGFVTLIHTSFVTDDQADRLLHQGARAILAKPAQPRKLLMEVRQALDERPRDHTESALASTRSLERAARRGDPSAPD